MHIACSRSPHNVLHSPAHNLIDTKYVIQYATINSTQVCKYLCSLCSYSGGTGRILSSLMISIHTYTYINRKWELSFIYIPNLNSLKYVISTLTSFHDIYNWICVWLSCSCPIIGAVKHFDCLLYLYPTWLPGSPWGMLFYLFTHFTCSNTWNINIYIHLYSTQPNTSAIYARRLYNAAIDKCYTCCYVFEVNYSFQIIATVQNTTYVCTNACMHCLYVLLSFFQRS